MKVLLTTLLLSAAFVSSASAQTREFGYDRPGLDYKNFELNNPRMVLCEWSCEKEFQCRAWTYVKPGIQGPKARCWLKYAIPRAVKNNCCDSGTK